MCILWRVRRVQQDQCGCGQSECQGWQRLIGVWQTWTGRCSPGVWSAGGRGGLNSSAEHRWGDCGQWKCGSCGLQQNAWSAWWQGKRPATCSQRHCSVSHWIVVSWRRMQLGSNRHQWAAEELHPLLCQKHLSRAGGGIRAGMHQEWCIGVGVLDLGESWFSCWRPVQGSLAVLGGGEHTVKRHQDGGTVGNKVVVEVN